MCPLTPAHALPPPLRVPLPQALKGAAFEAGVYEWTFFVADYFIASCVPTSGQPFLDVFPLRSHQASAVHVPLSIFLTPSLGDLTPAHGTRAARTCSRAGLRIFRQQCASFDRTLDQVRDRQPRGPLPRPVARKPVVSVDLPWQLKGWLLPLSPPLTWLIRALRF